MAKAAKAHAARPCGCSLPPKSVDPPRWSRLGLRRLPVVWPNPLPQSLAGLLTLQLMTAQPTKENRLTTNIHKRPKNVMTLLASRKPLERSWKLGSGLDCCGHAAAHVPPHHQRRLVHAVQTKLPNASQRHIRNSHLSLLWLYIRASKHHGTTGDNRSTG